MISTLFPSLSSAPKQYNRVYNSDVSYLISNSFKLREALNTATGFDLSFAARILTFISTLSNSNTPSYFEAISDRVVKTLSSASSKPL